MLLPSALGQHDEAPHCLNFLLYNQLTAYATNHMDLLKRLEVAAQVVGWLGRWNRCADVKAQERCVKT